MKSLTLPAVLCLLLIVEKATALALWGRPPNANNDVQLFSLEDGVFMRGRCEGGNPTRIIIRLGGDETRSSPWHPQPLDANRNDYSLPKITGHDASLRIRQLSA